MTEHNAISINVYMYETSTRKVHLLRSTNNVKSKHYNLLLLTQETSSTSDAPIEAASNQHYCWIHDIGKLLASQLSTNRKKTFLCDRCFNYFWSREKMDLHNINCVKQNECQIEMPQERHNKVEFKNYKNQVICPFVIHADVEALLKKPDERFCRRESTKAIQQHEVYSIGYYLKCSYDDNLSYYRAKRGINCLDWFIKELGTLSSRLMTIFDQIVPIQMSPEDRNIKRLV